MIEIHTRKALAIEVGPHLRGEHVVDVLNRLAWRRKAPAINNPDFNPIKNAFAKLKAIIRARAARTIPPLECRQFIIELFTPVECANYFKASEYEPD